MAMTKVEKAAVDELRRKLALRWPDRARPTPMFWFGDYDRPYGEPKEGTYFVACGRSMIKVELTSSAGGRWGWQFDGGDRVQRGAYFEHASDARLLILWEACTHAAKELAPVWAAYDAEARP